MTIQATFTTLTLTVSLVSGSWTLASDEPTTVDLADAVPVQLEAQPLVLPGTDPLLPIETVARADCRGSSLGIRKYSSRGTTLLAEVAES